MAGVHSLAVKRCSRPSNSTGDIKSGRRLENHLRTVMFSQVAAFAALVVEMVLKPGEYRFTNLKSSSALRSYGMGGQLLVPYMRRNEGRETLWNLTFARHDNTKVAYIRNVGNDGYAQAIGLADSPGELVTTVQKNKNEATALSIIPVGPADFGAFVFQLYGTHICWDAQNTSHQSEDAYIGFSYVEDVKALQYNDSSI
ncbi:uncharacterized protein BT62DRAFT_1005259 [Guyanagaster necrorhizus]|uniref:Uncharacterized protein n=1 Tax=Guyanagaster necrorhizus TaxID=856835 RepID=A0A9P7VSW1_9AGAR|nr:uncharacterized protein BT62DRAFT_1005259 [Guyanagaster necrorhizus MCA 3950]KAG7446866.1 hypothetical protein BT62DRAFT_1005259 [Guyanagaster necrorhizus MCA 3950]